MNKGLSYIPAPRHTDRSTFDQATHQFTNRVLTTWFFRHKQTPYKHVPFKPKSTWCPPSTNLPDTVSDYISEVKSISKNVKISSPIPNLTQQEISALKELKQNKNIIIKPADKGSSVVIQSKEDYRKEAFRQLNNSDHYKPLEDTIAPTNAQQITDILLQLHDRKHIDAKQLDYLRPPPEPRPRFFYLLPKIHKPVESWPLKDIPPGRPIVSDCGSESYASAKLLDHFLKPLANKHPSYIKDTYDFLDKIRSTKISESSFFFTIDVESLYTNIETRAGLRALGLTVDKHKPKNFPLDLITELLKINLEGNDFMFDDKFFLQIKGTAMGKIFAPSYADIYMSVWEQEALSKCSKKPLVFYRYLDDIFGVWEHSETDFWEFFDILNNHHKSIKLKATIDRQSIDFLDITSYKGDNFDSGRLIDTKVFFKPTDSHQLLHKKSFHPKHTFGGVIKSQFLRFFRICNNKKDFDSACNILMNSLQSRGYSKRFLRKIKTDTVFEYSANPKSLQNNDSGFFKCKRNCSMCKYTTDNLAVFHSNQFKKNFGIKHSLDCKSSNVIYLISCLKCQKQYVGETMQCLNSRFYKHSSDIRLNRDSPVGQHFSSQGHDINDLTISAIEQVGDQGNDELNKMKRLEREKFWIGKLGTQTPHGLNLYNTPSDKILPLVIPHTPTSHLLAHKIKLKYNLLQHTHPKAFNSKFITCYTRTKNLKDILVRSKFSG